MNRNQTVYPGLPQAWVIFAVYLAVAIATGLILSIINTKAGIQTSSIGNFISYNVSLLFVIWFAWRYRKMDLEKPLFFQPVHSLLYPLLLVFTLGIAVFLDPLTNLIPMPEKIEQLFEMLATRDIWTFMMVGISGPILEEVLFRGIILDGFLTRYKPGKAIFWSAFLFGLFHLNPWQFIPGFLIGLFLGYIYMKTRSLIPVILVHMVNNSFSYLIMYIYGKDVKSFVDLFENSSDYLIFFSVSTVIAGISLLFINKIINQNPEKWSFNSKTNSSLLQEPAVDSEGP